MNFAALSDGVHPWLSLNLIHDPSEIDLCHLSWAPDGKTLAYLDGSTLYTWNPSNYLKLSGGSVWRGPFWSPDSTTIVLSSPEKTLIIDSSKMAIKEELNGDQIIWWSGPLLCSAPKVNPAKRNKSEVQRFLFGSRELSLPAGLSLVSASSDGAVLVAQENHGSPGASSASLLLLGMDVKTGAVIWTRPAPTLSSQDFGRPAVLWNEGLQIAAESIDAGGGFDLHAYIASSRATVELKFANSANYSWVSGPMSWIGDEVFAPLTLCRYAQPNSKEVSVHFWNELSLYDARSGELRSVATGLPFESAAASDKYVALLIREDDQMRIVVSPWLRDSKGRITGITYVPAARKAEMART